MENQALKNYATVTKLVHYTSKFAPYSSERYSRQYSTGSNGWLSSSVDLADCCIIRKDLQMTSSKPLKAMGSNRLCDKRLLRQLRMASMWPEWNEADINAEVWEVFNIRKKDAVSSRVRNDTKTSSTTGNVQGFEDPEGKIELPPSLKVEFWKRPTEFLSIDTPPVIVDTDYGIKSFDLITSNEHLHHSETIRKIISEIMALWDVSCRKESKKNSQMAPNITNEFRVIERTWRPWEHIYAMNKVSKQPFVTPINPSGKYVVRLYFLGTWRKIVVDDTIPFDSENRCLLPQTSLPHELWPMLLSKALLKIISLNIDLSKDFPENNEVSVIHLLTGWIPEFIPLKYCRSEQIWSFLRYNRSNESADDNETKENETSCGPVPIFKWPNIKVEQPEETTNESDRSDDSASKISEDRSQRKQGCSIALNTTKDSSIARSTNNKDIRTTTSAHINTPKDMKKMGTTSGTTLVEDSLPSNDDQTVSEAPKMIAMAIISCPQSTRASSFSEVADRSERLRRCNLNNSFTAPMLLTSIRDIPLEPPPSPEYIPPWKLIRPKQPKKLPHAEPIISHEPKLEHWIEITSPYINHSVISSLNKPVNTSATSNRSRKHSSAFDNTNMIEIDESENIENEKPLVECTVEPAQDTPNLKTMPSAKESSNINIQEKLDPPVHTTRIKSRGEIVTDKIKTSRKSTAASIKVPIDLLSVKNKAKPRRKKKGNENDHAPTSIDAQSTGNSHEQRSSPITIPKHPRKSYTTPKTWMDFDDFCICFTSLVIYHNPRNYRFNQKYTEIKFVPYQQPMISPAKDKKKETTPTVVQQPMNLQDDRSSLYLFVDSTRETLTKNIKLLVNFTCLSRWYDAFTPESAGSNEKNIRSTNLSNEKNSNDINPVKNIVSQKDIVPQPGSLFVEIYSWKSVTTGQPILRIHTMSTKAALLTLTPGRHVLRLTHMCPLAFNVQVLSDTNDILLTDEDHLLNKIVSVPENAEFLIRAEELLLALDDSVRNFHVIDQQPNKLLDLFQTYCQNAPTSLDLTIQTCSNIFNQALYSTLRSLIPVSDLGINADVQFAWRCFTNDLVTPDILAAYEAKRLNIRSVSRFSGRATVTSTVAPAINKKNALNREKSSDDKTNQKQQQTTSILQSSVLPEKTEELQSEVFAREWTQDEIEAIINIQKSIRGFLQRRITLARMPGTDKNLRIQQALQSTMSLLKIDQNKSAVLFLKNFLALKPELIQCFSFHHDDWNMVKYQDYEGTYSERLANTWFVLFREIFYVNNECLIAAKLFTNLPNTKLRIINNDTYDEIPLVFNRLKPTTLTKNKNGYTFFAEGKSLDQPIVTDRFRLRLITSYANLPEIRNDQISSSFITKDVLDYYIPNKEQIICRYHVMIADNIGQTDRSFHAATIYFRSSKPDVLMRLTVLDGNEEIVSVEGRGFLVLPAILFMRATTNVEQIFQSVVKTLPKVSAGTRKKDQNNTTQGNLSDSTAANNARLDTDRIPSTSTNTHKYTIQVTLLNKSWPLTVSQWQFVEKLKEQEKDECKVFNRPQSPVKAEPPKSSSKTSKRTGQTNTSGSVTPNKAKSSSTATGRTSAASTSRPKSLKENTEKTIDTTKPHWILRIVSDADKAAELTVKKDTERKEELMNIKRAWEALQVGRAEKALESRQRFLDSIQPKVDESSPSEITDDTTYISETRTDEEPINTPVSTAAEQQATKKTSNIKKSTSSTKKSSGKEEVPKQAEVITAPSQTDETLLDEPPPAKCKIFLPLLDLKPFLKRKLLSDSSVILDEALEQEDLKHRLDSFVEYSQYLDEFREYRQDDRNTRYQEKVRQLEEYVILQGKIDQIRRITNESRELFRQRILATQRTHLQELAAQEQMLIDAEKEKLATVTHKKSPKKNLTGKKKTKLT